MVKTHGLTHISLAVRDPERSLRFYRKVFGVKEYYRDEDSIQVQGPGPHDVLAFERKTASAGAAGPGLAVEYRYFWADPAEWHADVTFGTATDRIRFGRSETQTLSIAFDYHF